MPSRSATWSSESSRSIVTAAPRGSPSTRSPMMLRWICDAPAAIVSASVRSRSSTSSLPSTCERVALEHAQAELAEPLAAPRSTRASSPSRRGPARPRAACETLRFVSAHSASNSAAQRPSSRRCAGVASRSGARSSHEAQRVDQLAHERGAALERRA